MMKHLCSISTFILFSIVSIAQSIENSAKNSIIISTSGNSNDLAYLISEAINNGFDDINIVTSKNWVWNSTVTIPELRRVSIWSNMPKGYDYSIKIRCGNRNPAIDAQGSLFTTIRGLNFLGDGKDSSKEPACLILYARMPDRSSSSNHVLADNIIDGSFYYCCIYNIGAEESNYINNYVSFSGSHNVTITEKNAVYIYSENDVFPEIRSKRPRPNGSSMSAVTNSNEVIKSFVKGTSIFYFGIHAQDISLNINYAVTPENSSFITIESIAGNIHVSPNRVELTKSSHLIKVLNNNNVGPINLEKGSFIRSDIENKQNEVFAIDVDGSSTSQLTLNISPSCNFTTTTFKPDTKLIRIKRILKSSDINLNSTSEDAEVTINKLIDTKLLMKSQNKFFGLAERSSVMFSSFANFLPITPTVISNLLSGSITIAAGKMSIKVANKGKFNRGIATSNGDHYCYIKFDSQNFTIYANDADKSDQIISYQVWSE